MESRPDGEIIAAVLGGDVNAYSELIERHQRYVFGVCVRYVPHSEVPGVAHETFVKAFQSLKNFRGECPFQHYLARIAVRTSYDYWRELRGRKEVAVSALSSEHSELLESVMAGAAEQRFSEEARQAAAHETLHWALAQLSAEDRMIVALLHLDGYSVNETAELLGWSATNVKVRAFRARQKLKGILESRVTVEEHAK